MNGQPADGGRYALACAEEKVKLIKELSHTLDDVLLLGDQANDQLQDDWDDALQAANRHIAAARRELHKALVALKEGV